MVIQLQFVSGWTTLSSTTIQRYGRRSQATIVVDNHPMSLLRLRRTVDTATARGNGGSPYSPLFYFKTTAKCQRLHTLCLNQRGGGDDEDFDDEIFQLFNLDKNPEEEEDDDEEEEEEEGDIDPVKLVKFGKALGDEDEDDDDDDESEVLIGKFEAPIGFDDVTTNDDDDDGDDHDPEGDIDHWKSNMDYPILPEFNFPKNDDSEGADQSSYYNDKPWTNKTPLSKLRFVDKEADEGLSRSSKLVHFGNSGMDQASTADRNAKENLKPNDTPSGNTSSSVDLESLCKRMDAMQQQLDLITKLVVNKVGMEENAPVLPPRTDGEQRSNFLSEQIIPQQSHQLGINRPMKVMLFIDGTWLYYSIFERLDRGCPIVDKFGYFWQNRYQVDWAALPQLICQKLQPRRQHGPFELVRVFVFTSYKAGTLKTSDRYKMFEEMQRQPNYELHMLETVGKNEKCVDISLAVEMIHYATIPNSFDVAVVLTGDKDFMPAMKRTRQKGRQVALASMRSACNRDIATNRRVNDYPTIWLEDYLDEWIVPKATTVAGSTRSKQASGLVLPKANHTASDVQPIQDVALKRIVIDFIAASGLPCVSARDIGRYLKMLVLPTSTSLASEMQPLTMLDVVKKKSGNLFHFFQQTKDFFSVEGNGEAYDRVLIGLKMEASVAEKLVMKQYDASLASDVERAFFETYSSDLLKESPALYEFTEKAFGVKAKLRFSSPDLDAPVNDGEETPRLQLPEEFTRDYNLCTLLELKERCRERQLPVSGKKSALLKRIRDDVEQGIARLEEEYAAAAEAAKHRAPPAISRPVATGVNRDHQIQSSSSLHYLAGLIEEYLQARGGSCSSRDVGRYLAANKASPERRQKIGADVSALQELKHDFGNLRNFITQHGHLFVGGEDPATSPSSLPTDHFSFPITLREQAKQLS